MDQHLSHQLMEFLKALQEQKTDLCQQLWPDVVRNDPMEAASAIRMTLLSGKLELAQALLAQSSTEDPWLAAARFMVLMLQGDMAAARRYGSKALNEGVDAAVIYDFAAQVMDELEQYEAALGLNTRMLYIEPSQERFEKVLLLLMRTGRLEETKQLLEELSRVHPQWDLASLRLLRACMAGDSAAAQAACAELDPDDDSFLSILVRLYAALLLKQDPSSALEALQKMDLSLADLAAADALISLERTADAAAAVERILTREGDALSEGAKLELARRLAWTGSDQRALDLLTGVSFSSLAPQKQLLIQLDRADLLRKTGRKAEADAVYNELLIQSSDLLTQMPTATEMHIIRLRCYIGLGRQDKVKEAADFAKQISKDDRTRQIIDAMIS